VRLRLFRFVFTLILFLTVVGAGPAFAAEGQVSLNFKDINLVELVQTIGELTGKNFVYEERELKGTVTISSPKTMTLGEAYEVFNTVLSLKGFTIVPSGKVNKIIKTKDALTDSLPNISEGLASDRYVTRVVPVENIDASQLASSILKPLVPKTGYITAYEPTNTLIITDSSANISRMVRIINEIDIPGAGAKMELIELQFADAKELAEIGTKVLAESDQGATSTARRRTARVTASRSAAKVLAYERTNVLIVIADPADIETIHGLVDKLDRKAPQGRSGLNVYYLENADAESLAKTLNEILTGIKSQEKTSRQNKVPGQAPLSEGPVTITADKPTNSLIINASPEDLDVLKGIIAELDIKRKQVYVEALILELSMDATKSLGVSLQGGVDTGSDSLIFGTSNLNSGPVGLSDLASSGDSGVPSLLGRTINGLMLGGLFNPITVPGLNGQELTIPALSVLIDLSKKTSDVNILSAPRLLTSDNEEAEIIVGSNVPVISSRLTDTGSSGLAQSVSVERQDAALTLRFTPQVTEGNLVRLNVFQEITDIAPSNPAVGDPDEVGPTFTKRQIRNTVLAENGKTIVLGGLIGTNVQQTESKVPLLGDLPLLGWLFRSEGTTHSKTNLLVFITPKIIRSSQDLAEITERSRLASQGMQTEKLRDSVPAEYFKFNSGVEAPASPGATDNP